MRRRFVPQATVALLLGLVAASATHAASGLNTLPTTPISIPFPTPQVSEQLSASATSVSVGSTFTVTDIVTDVNIQGETPAVQFSGLGTGLTVQSLTSTSGSCSTAGAPTCLLPSLEPEHQVDVVLTLVASAPGSYTLSVGGNPGSSSPNASFVQSATTVITVTAPPTANLSVSVPLSALTLRVGQTERVGIVVSNSGTAAGTTSLRIALPPMTTLVAARPKSGSCSRSPLLCTLVAVAPEQSDLVVLTLRGAKAGVGSVTVAQESGGGSSTSQAGASIRVLVSSGPAAKKGR